MIILCEYCDLRFICYDDWMEHLLSSGHQDVISKTIDSWESPLNERSLVITINGGKPDRSDICWYFASYGLVSDAFFESDLQFCVIQLDKKDYAAHAVLMKHSIENANLSLRLKSDISDAEWLQLSNNKMSRRNTTVEDLENRRKELKESFDEQQTKLMKTLSSLPIDSQMEIFERETRLSSSELTLRQNLVNDINRLFNGDYPKCILCPYGSYLTGLGNKSSVLHIYFDAIGLSAENANCYRGLLPPKKEIIESLGKCIGRINQKQLFCHDFVVLPGDATPCIKFVHYKTGVACRFTFESFLPVQTSKLIALVMKLDARLPGLFLFVRYWGKYHKITGPQLISSYSLNLLLLVFLTTKKIIPSVAALQSMGNDIKEINGWETGFCEDQEKIVNVMSFLGISSRFDTNASTGKPSAKSILQLAVDFFKMYAHSDLQSQVVCSVIGDFLPKSAFERGKESELPKGLEAYKTRTTIQKRRLNTESLLCIQDPFDLVSNISSSTPEEIIWKFQFLCADTIDNIETVLNSPDSNLMDVFNLKQTDSVQESRPSATAISSAVAHSSSQSYLSLGNQSSSSYSYENSSIARQTDISQSYDENSLNRLGDSYVYPQTRDIPFSYGNHPKTQPTEPIPHHPDAFHHSHGHQGPHHSSVYHPQHHQDHPSQQQEMLHGLTPHPSGTFHPQQYNTQQRFETNEGFTIPNHLQSYHQPEPRLGLLPTPVMPPNISPQLTQRFPIVNPVQHQMCPPPQKSSLSQQRPNLVSITKTSVNPPASAVPKAPHPPALTQSAPGEPQLPKRVRTRGKKNPRPGSNAPYPAPSAPLPAPYSSLKFGNLEKIMVYPPDDKFQRLFKEYFGNLVSEAILNMRMKVLWCMFAKDFFSDIWWKSFMFEVAEINESSIPITTDPTNSANKIVVDYHARISKIINSPVNVPDKSPDPKKQKLEEPTEEEKDKPIVYIFPANENPHQRKFFEIQIKYAHSHALLCTITNTNFIVGRGQVRNNALLDKDLLTRFPDPLDWEGKVTKLTFVAKKAQGPPLKSKFIAKLSLDATKEEAVTLVLKDIRDFGSAKGANSNSTTHVSAIIKDLLPRYSNFRFKKWLSTE